ncbi:class I SAM-dependent methyltransferase [Litchfieldia salsa]|uniref:Putative SAM-dependent methyltransferase n=1 Tax=Litchfieldia salsa TaxID=930152 RepID=A0A1H0THN4_9BACI|nr:class I SAM-dependent methyltransferase [Litchfieldia salsa]SDP53088.1 Putative SAM-dependent methyltransferase [Litchfieldia salsa]
MIVTTAGRTSPDMIKYAEVIANDLCVPFRGRKKQSVEEIQKILNDDIMVVGKNRIEIHMKSNSEPLFFHPNSAMFRIKRISKGDHDPFLKITDLSNGDTLLDCTLGLGSDSIVASYAVGNTGGVVGLEANRYVAYVVSKGLKEWDSGNKGMNDAMSRIRVFNKDHLNFMQECDDNSFDVVYFDPMFEEGIFESNGIKGLNNLAMKSGITASVIKEAKRVARKRIVLKDHWKSQSFQDLGFEVVKRKSAKFHYGSISLTK